MSKKVAVIAVNPVNGFGLFQYLETFYENKIPYKTFAVADSKDIKTNSGIALSLDGTVYDLKGREKDFDALVFACGDAIPKFGENKDKPYYKAMFDVIGEFNAQGKILAGHCAAALLFDIAGADKGKRVAVHPYGKPSIKQGKATDERHEVDGNIYTAQTEQYIWTLMPDLLKALK